MVRYKQRHRPIRFIKNALRALRAERRWSQDDLAERMGFQSKYRVWQLENEEGPDPTIEEKRRLARIFRTRAAVIFPPPRVTKVPRPKVARRAHA